MDVSAWAKNQGLTEEKLLRFDEYARESFYQNSYRQIFTSYAQSDLSAESIERLARCFAETNLAYFTGELLDREKLSEEIAFWVETTGEGMETAYLRSILLDDAPNPLKIDFYARESG